MKLPPLKFLLRSLAFWKAVAYVVAALLFLLRPDAAIHEAAILAAILAVLKLFDINPELRARGFMR